MSSSEGNSSPIPRLKSQVVVSTVSKRYEKRPEEDYRDDYDKSRRGRPHSRRSRSSRERSRSHSRTHKKKKEKKAKKGKKRKKDKKKHKKRSRSPSNQDAAGHKKKSSSSKRAKREPNSVQSAEISTSNNIHPPPPAPADIVRSASRESLSSFSSTSLPSFHMEEEDNELDLSSLSSEEEPVKEPLRKSPMEPPTRSSMEPLKRSSMEPQRRSPMEPQKRSSIEPQRRHSRHSREPEGRHSRHSRHSRERENSRPYSPRWPRRSPGPYHYQQDYYAPKFPPGQDRDLRHLPEESWKSQVDAFVSSLGLSATERASTGSNANAQEAAEEVPLEDFQSSPLIRYVGKCLSSKAKSHPLVLEGVFQYNLLSLLSAAEWVAAKSLDLLEKAGYKENRLYFLATSRGADVLLTELKGLVSDKIDFKGKNQALIPQLFRTFEYIIRYFTGKGGEDDKSEEDEADDSGSDEDTSRPSRPLRTGVAVIIKRLADEEQAKIEEKEKLEASLPVQPPINPWSQLQDHLQSESLRELTDMKTNIGRNLLRDNDESLCHRTSAFDVAQEMVSALVLAGYSHATLQHLVLQAPTAEDILPPKDRPAGDRRKKCYIYDTVIERLYRMRSEIPCLSDAQLDYLVRKSLLYVMRGCNKMPQTVHSQPIPPCNVVFDYLPEGLREMESGMQTEQEEASGQPSGQSSQPLDHLSPEERESTDPLNSILNPNAAEEGLSSHKRALDPNELPNRNYLFGSTHVEWVILQGKPQIYQLSTYLPGRPGSKSPNLTLYAIPDALKRHKQLLEDLDFVANPDRAEYYYVHAGVGCVKAISVQKAVDAWAEFLSSSTNIVMTFASAEQLAIVLDLLQEHGHKSLLLDTLKGFSIVDESGVDGAQGVYEALINGLAGSQPSYANYAQKRAFPSFSPKAEAVKRSHKSVCELYTLQVFIASELKAMLGQQQQQLVAEGLFAAPVGQKLSDKSSIVASRVVRLLVEAGFDKASLQRAFSSSPDYHINSSVILDKMPCQSQRLKATEQTVTCMNIVRAYFQPKKMKMA